MIGVVADDITGANDIGIMFAKAGIVTHVYAYGDFEPRTAFAEGGPRPGAVILDTNSRLDDAETAYAKVFDAANRLREAGASLFINKTCSVFRGNIGAEFDAMLDALNREFAVVVLGFPKNGRTTVRGIHYVHGRKLEESEFRHDPVHPMTRSSLVDILQGQTRRKVGLTDYATVEQGAQALREHLIRMSGRCSYCIVDVPDQAALRTIAEAVRDDFILCGSSAIAEELAPLLDIPREASAALSLERRESCGILCTAGSLMPQTAAQIAHMRDLGTPVFELDSRQLLEDAGRRAAIERLVGEIGACLLRGSHAILHSSRDRSIVEETKRSGIAKGLTVAEVSRIVSDSLAEITVRVTEETGQNRLLIAGGETSAAVCARMGVTGLRVWKEIQTGLPSCVTLTEPRRLLVLKSGSFGSERFFEEGIRHLMQE
jgi:uncharacterized protein YgbK (DUF1537 family)